MTDCAADTGPDARSDITARRVLTPSGWMPDRTVHISDGIIDSIEAPTSAPDVDILTPGFIDIQVNGHAGCSVTTADGADWEVLDDALLRHGVTSWCPTVVTMPHSDYGAALERITRAAKRRGPRPDIIGVHLEGPYLGSSHGAHRNVPSGEVDLDWIAGLPDLVSIMTLGPERPNANEAIEALCAHGIVAAIGHTEAGHARTTAAIDSGATLFTHLGNASGAIHQREPGAIGAALTDDRISVSLIADNTHLHPAMIELIWRCKGSDGCVLITDAAAGRLGHSALDAADDAPRLADGTLAGSNLTMDAAVRVATEAGMPLADALRSASATPARLLGLDDRGTIAPGTRADLVALDEALQVTATWIGGQPVRER